jgi:hypothetical protein
LWGKAARSDHTLNFIGEEQKIREGTKLAHLMLVSLVLKKKKKMMMMMLAFRLMGVKTR